jgi:hypothetical protein
MGAGRDAESPVGVQQGGGVKPALRPPQG